MSCWGGGQHTRNQLRKENEHEEKPPSAVALTAKPAPSPPSPVRASSAPLTELNALVVVSHLPPQLPPSSEGVEPVPGPAVEEGDSQGGPVSAMEPASEAKLTKQVARRGARSLRHPLIPPCQARAVGGAPGRGKERRLCPFGSKW